MESLRERPYLFGVQDRLPPQIYEAFYDCFQTEAGRIVLDHLYWNVMMCNPENVRAVGKQDLFRSIITNIRLGWREKNPHSPLFDWEEILLHGNGHTPQ